MSEVYFYRFAVTKQVFFKSQLTYALVNLKPLVPGHVLVVPIRTSVLRFADLTTEESIDYMQTLQLVHKFIISTYKADSLNIAIQDGPESGQSIPHLHTHLIPRYKVDGYGDDIYKMVEATDLETLYRDFEQRRTAIRNGASDTSNLQVKDEEREELSLEAMHSEAQWLALELAKFTQS